MAAAAAAAALNAQQQLELQKIPIFYGDHSKDIFTVEQFIARINRAGDNAAPIWPDNTRCACLGNAVRGDALLWMDTAEMRHGQGILANWANLSAAFIRAYSKFKTTRCQMALLTNLQQQSSESVTKFHTRVAKAILDVRGLDPACPALNPAWPAAVLAVAPFVALADDVREDAARRHVVHGDTYRENRIAKHLFVAGLQTKLRDELLKQGIDNLDFNGVFEEALGLEKALTDIGAAAKIHSVDADDDRLRELEAEIQAIQFRRGRGGKGGRGGNRPYRGKTGASRGGSSTSTSSSSTATNPDIICYYCGRKGHVSAKCHARQRGDPPLKNNAAVDADNNGEQQQQQGEHSFSFSQSLYESNGGSTAQMSAISADYLN